MRIRYDGKPFRALNPAYARDPLSGQGAALYGGRFNRRGTPALYCSPAIMTAVRAANQVGNLQRATPILHKAEIERVFEIRSAAALEATGMSAAARSDPAWRDQMRTSGEARTQALAANLTIEGFHGPLVESFAPGTTAADLNLALWRWGTSAPARLIVIVDEGRLRR